MPTMTAAQRRDQQRERYLAMMEACPSRQVLDAISDKWVTLVLHALADGRLRRGALSREIAGATQKMLTQTLRNMERDGFVERTVIPAVPVQVEYELTPLGRGLRELVCAIVEWSEAHLEEILEARAATDARQS